MKFQRQENNLTIKGRQILEQSWKYLNDNRWNLEKRNQENDCVFSMSLPNMGKLYKLSGMINISPKYLLEELFYKIEKVPSWNPSLIESRIIQSINKNTDITYQVSADFAGIVSSRDFINLRYWDIKEGSYCIAYCGTDYPSLKINNNYVRGENKMGLFALKSIDGEQNKCIVEWLLNVKLNVQIPQSILSRALVKMMFDYIKFLRNYIKTLT